METLTPGEYVTFHIEESEDEDEEE